MDNAQVDQLFLAKQTAGSTQIPFRIVKPATPSKKVHTHENVVPFR